MSTNISGPLRVSVQPEMLRWACERSRRKTKEIVKRFPGYPAWERGEKKPTLKQLESFAKATYAPIGFLFLKEPPEETIPIPDFRTIADEPVGQPSANLLDMLYLCQQRQAWYRDFAAAEGEERPQFIGSISQTDDIESTAARMRDEIGFDLEERRRLSTWVEALRRFIQQVERAGVLVMVSGVVGSNNKRKLDPEEFRGFALVDDLAPLIFINGADTKAAQMFTLAHELVHIWLGQSALSDSNARIVPEHNIERWCNRVAAEFLVPLGLVQKNYKANAKLRDQLDELARRFKVSTLVILRRIRDTGALSANAYWTAYEEEISRLISLTTSSGGNFYLTLNARVSQRFAHSIVMSTLEGRSSYTEALRLLGIRNLATFEKLSSSLGMTA